MPNILVHNDEDAPRIIISDEVSRYDIVKRSDGRLTFDLNDGGVSPLAIDTEGVLISEAYGLPTTVGLNGQTLIYTGDGAVEWGYASSVTEEFISSEISLTSSYNLTTIAHGLGGKPKGYSVSLRCKVAELGYSNNEETNDWYATSGMPISVSWTDTNVKVTTNNGLTIRVVDTTNGNESTITLGRWVVVIKAWK